MVFGFPSLLVLLNGCKRDCKGYLRVVDQRGSTFHGEIVGGSTCETAAAREKIHKPGGFHTKDVLQAPAV